jgi:DNA-binding NarL/FixJ family response regulator
MDEKNERSDDFILITEYNLTEREVEILQCAANGMSIQKTGETLFISIDTVESHRTKVIQKLKAANITEAVSIGFRNKIIK